MTSNQFESSESKRLQVGPSASGGRQVYFRMGAKWFLVLFLSVWLCGWAAGEVSAIRSLLVSDPPKPQGPWFTVFWLVAWTLGGAAASFFLAWMLLGEELVEANRATLTHTARMLGLRRVRAFQASQISKLRFTEQKDEGSIRSCLAFDYGTRTIRVFHNIESGEATRAIDTLGDALGIRRQQ